MTAGFISKISVVIPTYNRQSYALRNMRFWSGRGASVYVVDGSETPIHENLRQGIDANVTYSHMPISLHERLFAATEMVRTPYSIMLSDDEFFIPSALEACVSELESKADLVACNGRCARFGVLNDEISGHTEYPRMKDYSICQERPVDRIVAHMAPYVPSTIYAVVRTDVWIKAIKAATETVIAMDSFEEIAFELVVSYSGKSKVISELSWLRSSEVAPVRTTDTSHEKRVSVGRWLDEDAYALERSMFFGNISRMLSNDGLQDQKISYDLEMAVRVYERDNKRNLSLAQKFKRAIFARMSANVKNVLRPVIAGIFPNYRKYSLLGIASELEKAGVKVDMKEIFHINKVVADFHAVGK